MPPMMFSNIALLISILNGFSFTMGYNCPRDDNFPSGNDVSIDVDISSNTSFTFSWNVPNGGVDLINLEYICYTEDETPPNESDVVLSFSERKHGSEFIEVADLESPIECIVFGCYSDDYIFDMFKIESKTFILEVEPVVLPSPSPSPFPSPPPACECDIQSQRLRRDTPHEESASVNHITGYGVLVLGIVLVLSVIVCVLVAINAVLVLKMKKMKKEISFKLENQQLI